MPKNVSNNRVHHIKEFLPVDLAKIVASYVRLPIKERLAKTGQLDLYESIKKRDRERSQFYRDYHKSKQPPKPPKPSKQFKDVECDCGRVVRYYRLKRHLKTAIHLKNL